MPLRGQPAPMVPPRKCISRHFRHGSPHACWRCVGTPTKSPCKFSASKTRPPSCGWPFHELALEITHGLVKADSLLLIPPDSLLLVHTSYCPFPGGALRHGIRWYEEKGISYYTWLGKS